MKAVMLVGLGVGLAAVCGCVTEAPSGASSVELNPGLLLARAGAPLTAGDERAAFISLMHSPAGDRHKGQSSN
jgi:hypothetical protein